MYIFYTCCPIIIPKSNLVMLKPHHKNTIISWKRPKIPILYLFRIISDKSADEQTNKLLNVQTYWQQCWQTNEQTNLVTKVLTNKRTNLVTKVLTNKRTNLVTKVLTNKRTNLVTSAHSAQSAVKKTIKGTLSPNKKIWYMKDIPSLNTIR